MAKFGNIAGGAGKRVVSSMSLPAKARGKVAHVKQRDASPSVDEDFKMHSGRTNQTPGRKVNDALGKSQTKTVTSAKGAPGMPHNMGSNAGSKGSTKGFVESRGREFKGYK